MAMRRECSGADCVSVCADFVGEEYEASNNPGYSEVHELAYMQEDKARYTELVKKADDAVFEEYAAKKAAEFAALSADDQVRHRL